MQGGILALDFVPGFENVVATAGADHTGKVFDRESNRIVSSLTGHSKKVTGARPDFVGGTILNISFSSWRYGRARGLFFSSVLSIHIVCLIST